MRIEITLEGTWAEVLNRLAERLNRPIEDAVVYALMIADTADEPPAAHERV